MTQPISQQPFCYAQPIETGGNEIDQKTDIFSQETFGTLKAERLSQGRPFYIVECKNNHNTFYFEGSRFFEFYNRQKENHQRIYNPSTREEISSFVVYVSTSKKHKYTSVFDQTVANDQRLSLGVILSNPDLPQVKKMNYYFRYAEFLRLDERKTDLAIFCYREAAMLGHPRAKQELSVLHGKDSDIREALYWVIEDCEDRPVSVLTVRKILQIAECFERALYTNYALGFYNEAACRGNPVGIAKVIHHYTRGIASKTNPRLAKFWKNIVPLNLQKKSTLELMKLVKKLPRVRDATKILDIPEEIKNCNRPESIPSPLDFPWHIPRKKRQKEA